MHLVFWSIPIFFEIVPLFSGSTFGMDDLYPEFVVVNCSVRIGVITDAKLATMLVTLQLSKFIAVGIIGVMYYYTKLEIDKSKKDPVFNEVTRIMGLYPRLFFICWVPWNVFYSVIFFVENPDPYKVVVAATVFNIIQSFVGFFVAVIYFYGSKQARSKWYVLLTQCTTEEVSLLESKVYIESSSGQVLSSHENIGGICIGVYDNDLEVVHVSDSSCQSPSTGIEDSSNL
jgi:hypothetical protein